MGFDWSWVAERFRRKSLLRPPIVVPPAPPATIHGTHWKSVPLDGRIFSGSISRSLGSNLSRCGLSLDLNLSLSFTIALSLGVESEEGRGIGLEKEENNRSVRERREEKRKDREV
jgi:hypothetical protein